MGCGLFAVSNGHIQCTKIAEFLIRVLEFLLQLNALQQHKITRMDRAEWLLKKQSWFISYCQEENLGKRIFLLMLEAMCLFNEMTCFLIVK